MRKFRPNLYSFSAPAVLAIGLLSQPVLAQEAPEDVTTSAAEEKAPILVTGSRIARPNFDTIEPSVVVDSEQIEARGFETLGQALNEQPSFGVPGSSPVGGQSDFGQGQSFVNFLGLGSQRTLTLVNGRRFVSSNTSSIFGPTGAGSQVDLNIIPTKLVDRVETIAVGGAPIYGSDAISGTINVILKRNYEGFELDGQYGVASRGDAANYRIRGLAGQNFADGRGNITFAAEYNKGEGLTFTDRKVTSSGLFYSDASNPLSAFNQELYPDRRIPALSDTGVPLVGGDIFGGLDFPLSPEQELLVFGANGFNFGVQDANGGHLKFDTNGNLIPLDFGRYAGSPGSFGIDFSGGNGFSLVPTSNLLSETRRYSAITTAQYELSDSIRAFGEAWYSNSKGRNLRDQPVYNTALFGPAGSPDGNIIMSVNNPFLSPAARAAIVNSINNNPFSDQNQLGTPQDYFYLGRANTDLATGESVGEVEVMRFVGGFDGDFEMLAGTWNWELMGLYGRSKTTGRQRGLVQQNFENAVDAVLVGGNIVCRPGAVNASIATVSSTCAPLNLFGTGRASQAALDYISAIATPVSLNKQTDFTATLAGPVFPLPGGDFSVAIGYEHRKESQNFDPGEFFRGELQADGSYESYGRSVPIQPVNGAFNTDEIFGELRAELISPATNSFIDTLEFQAAGRYVDHSIAGGDFTWTVGGRVKPINDITIRGNYTRSIRAPAITEAFNPSSDFFGFASDPCDRNNIGNGPNPSVRAANCVAAGVPANFSSLSNSRSFSQAIAGNANLDNEKAKSFTVGVVLEPSFLPGFKATFDWVDIKLEDVISELSGSQVVANCYDSSDFPNSEFCARVTRGANSQISFIETGYFNSAELRYKGLLGAVEYTTDVPFISETGEIGLSVSYQYLDTLTSRADAGSAAGQTHDSIGYSRHDAVMTMAYSDDNFGLFGQVSYIGKTKIDPEVSDTFYPDGQNDIPSVMFVNMGANFTVDERFTLRFVVDNVFDKKPPYPYPASGGTITYFRGVLGTYIRVGASVEF